MASGSTRLLAVVLVAGLPIGAFAATAANGEPTPASAAADTSSGAPVLNAPGHKTLTSARTPMAAFSQGVGVRNKSVLAAPTMPQKVSEENVLVRGQAPYASIAQFHTNTAQLGPLGQTSILTAPVSVTVLTQDFLANQQLRTLKDALRALPSVEVRDQQGLEVSRRSPWASRVRSLRIHGSTASTSLAPPRSRSRTSIASRC